MCGAAASVEIALTTSGDSNHDDVLSEWMLHDCYQPSFKEATQRREVCRFFGQPKALLGGCDGLQQGALVRNHRHRASIDWCLRNKSFLDPKLVFFCHFRPRG